MELRNIRYVTHYIINDRAIAVYAITIIVVPGGQDADCSMNLIYLRIKRTTGRPNHVNPLFISECKQEIRIAIRYFHLMGIAWPEGT